MAVVLIHVDCLDCSAEFEAEVEVEKGMHAVIEDKLHQADWLYVWRAREEGYACPTCADKSEAGPQKPDGEPSNWREHEGSL